MSPDPAALRNRLVIATSMWREATNEPLPRMPAGDPEQQLETFELKLVEVMCAGATPQKAKEVADRDLGPRHDRPDDDPVKKRVAECHEELARLSARRAEADAE